MNLKEYYIKSAEWDSFKFENLNFGFWFRKFVFGPFSKGVTLCSGRKKIVFVKGKMIFALKATWFRIASGHSLSSCSIKVVCMRKEILSLEE